MEKLFAVLGTTALLVAIAVAPAAATNGMDMIGYGTRSIGMAGADVAVAGDAGSVSGNPAAVSEASSSSANIGVTFLMPTLSLQHNTPSGPDSVDGEAAGLSFWMPQIGYVHRLKDTPLALGFGLYAQGGMGTQDELTTKVSFMRFNPLLSYKVSEDVTLGATLMVGYAQCQFSFYPETYSPGMDGKPGTGDDFGGMDVTKLSSLGFAGRVGAQVKVGPMVRLGATYTSGSTIKLDGGNAKLQDFTWPQEVEAGIAITPAQGLTVAVDVKWINWSAAIGQPLLKVSNPETVGVPATPFTDASGNPAASDTLAFSMAWEDQWVYAIGVEYAVNAMHTLRAGYNYGKSPVPDANLNPRFPAIVEPCDARVWVDAGAVGCEPRLRARLREHAGQRQYQPAGQQFRSGAGSQPLAEHLQPRDDLPVLARIFHTSSTASADIAQSQGVISSRDEHA